MAALTFYLVNGVDANGWQSLSTSTQSAATCAAGWVVGTGSTNHSELFANTERASSTFTGTTVPDGTLDTTNKDAFRIPSALSGAFASANWSLQFAVQSTVQGGAADGRIRFRLIKANADGSSATEITAAQQQASLVTNVTTADSNSTLTFNPGAFRLDNQYLFVQVAWERTGAGGMTTTNMRLRTGSAATPTGTVITTSDFAADVLGDLSSTLGTATTTTDADLLVQGSATPTLGAATLSGTGAVDIQATLSSTLSAATLTADGTQTGAGFTGDLDVTLDAVTVAATVQADIQGSTTSTLSVVTLAGLATLDVIGTTASTLGNATISGLAVVDVAGVLNTTFSAATTSAAGTIPLNSVLSSTLGAATLAGSGGEPAVPPTSSSGWSGLLGITTFQNAGFN